MPHPYYLNGALVVGLIPSLFGVRAILNPEAIMQVAQFPIPTEPNARKMAHALMRLYGVRNTSISFLLALIWSKGDERMMANGLIGALIMCIADGFISRSFIGGGELNHWPFAPVCLGLMAGLYGWLE